MKQMQYSKNRDQSANSQSFLVSQQPGAPWLKFRRDHFFYIFFFCQLIPIKKNVQVIK